MVSKPDDERLKRWTRWSWWLNMLSWLAPFVLWGLFFVSLTVMPPGGGQFAALGRLVAFMVITTAVVAVLQLISLGMGMRVARHRPRVLWWVAPQMAIVLSLLAFANVWMSVVAMQNAGLVTGFAGDQIVIVATPLAIAAAIAVTVWWTRWILARTRADRMSESFATESRTERGE